MAKIVKNPMDKKYSTTFSLPMYLIQWLEKMRVDSPGFNRNTLVADILTDYMKKRGDYETKA